MLLFYHRIKATLILVICFEETKSIDNWTHDETTHLSVKYIFIMGANEDNYSKIETKKQICKDTHILR